MESLAQLCERFHWMSVPSTFPHTICYQHPSFGGDYSSLFLSIGNIKNKLWHGTKSDCLEDILRSRLIPSGKSRKTGKKGRPWGCLLGDGVYLAPATSKALTYGDVLLECTAALGKVFKATSARIPLDVRLEYNSIFADSGTFEGAWGNQLNKAEYCVFRPEQVLIDRVHVWPKEEPPQKVTKFSAHPCKIKGVVCYYASMRPPPAHHVTYWNGVTSRSYLTFPVCLLCAKDARVSGICNKYKKAEKKREPR